MAIDVVPEPDPEEREALERALAALVPASRDPRSEWWREGIREAVNREGAPS